MNNAVQNAQPAAAEVVRTARHGAVVCVTLDSPPVNALSSAVRKGLWRAIEEAEADSSVQAIVLVGQGGNFIAGADIREFGKPPVPPTLPELCKRIEVCNKPVVAVLNGAVLGGGLEIAMAAHHRIALADARLGLPEVQLGLMPGAGGTVRTPYLIGAQAALDMMLSGRHVKAQEAFDLGLVDRLVEGDNAETVGLACVRELLDQGLVVRRARDAGGLANAAEAQAAIDAAKADVAKKSRGLFSPGKIVESVQAALELPFDEAIAFERQAFLACLDSPQRAGLIHAFFSERETAKVPEARAATPRKVSALGVIGGGTMGVGITVAALDAGLPVTMVERDAEAIARGQANVEKVYDALVSKGRMSEAGKSAVMARYTPSTRYEDVRDADLVIEAVFEDIETKKAVFKELDRVCKPGAVLGTNTSFLDIDAIAASISRPQDVIGLHFFSPANVMKLLEIVVPAKASAEVVATAFDLARKLRKTPVRAGVCDGFIGNRIMAVYKQAVDGIMEDGASPYEIDEALRGFGYPMGTFQVADLAGGDIGWATRKRRAATRDPRARYVHVADRLCERGWFGQKTGRGFYLYPQGARTGQPDPEVLAILDEERDKKGIIPRKFTPEEIVRRYMAAMINEGARVVEEGIALRPLDVDVTFLAGYGFPRYRGGPMKYADMVGLDTVLADLQEFSREDPLFWKPAALLERLVAEGKKFESLN
ncbi:3-hydroxyacyl-CoA dehydrogenase NAD-binding domain-containing protein [Hydrogenophaga sp.]|uniref:3-hydroxyacyl-CoA dehydrogenase NAD-binding domain-containing protein n=1 Tax=Hydrogenophaga sp. TaxID=1904254 RepID=UPI003F6F88D3